MQTVFSRSFAERWSPRIGEPAARYQCIAYRLLSAGAFFGIITLTVFGIAENSHSVVFKAAADTAFGLAIIIFITGVAYLKCAARSISSHFDIKVGILNYPPLQDGAFERWKVRHGVQ
jgi:hypothetical protein